MAKPKLIIVGLDGGTYRIIDPLLKEKKLPNIERLVREGTRAVLRSTIPPLTAPAWVSFMTGKNPGKHGFFGFRKLDIREYDMSFLPGFKNAPGGDKFWATEVDHVLSDRFAGQTVWDILSEAGYKLCVVTVPMTYPAWEINGYMVSGFPNPDFKNPNTYPKEWGAEIAPLFDLSAVAYNNEENLIAECKKLIAKQTKLLLEKVKEGCDILSVVFSSIDFSQHLLWKYLQKKDSPYSEGITEMYQEVDKGVGEILQYVSQDTSVVVLSDHGAVACPENYFHTNTWLNQEGYLFVKEKNIPLRLVDFFLDHVRYRRAGLKEKMKKFLNKFSASVQKKASDLYFQTNRIEWAQSKAFRQRLDPFEGIVINLRGRQESGVVEKGREYEELRDEIIDKLLKLKDSLSGEKVVTEAHKREEVYSGSFVEKAPDIIVCLNPKYRGGLGIDSEIIQPVRKEFREEISGVHDMEGILVLNGPKFKKEEIINPANIVDVTPTVLFDLGLPVPDDMDGKVLLEAFKEPFSSESIKYSQINLKKKQVKKELSQKDQEEIEKSLRGLGYLG